MSEEKICPLLSMTKYQGGYCQEEKCAWWIKDKRNSAMENIKIDVSECAITRLAEK